MVRYNIERIIITYKTYCWADNIVEAKENCIICEQNIYLFPRKTIRKKKTA